MLLIPAIDLKDGQCVCVGQERDGGTTVVSSDAAAVADRWVEAGARRLHLTDLDGANGGAPVHADIIREIATRHPDLVLQAGGGIRDEDTAEAYLIAGADYIIIGTRAINTPHFLRDLCIEFGGHVLVGLDARGGKVAADGWSKLAHHDVVEVARHVERDGAGAIVLTDVERHGTLDGVDAEAVAALAREINIPVIAAGGIGSLEHLRQLCAFAGDGIAGAVLDRALYERRFEFAEAQRLADSLPA